MKTKYITNNTISSTERLCSQLFNYCVLYSISKKTGHEVALSTSPNRYMGLLSKCFDNLFPDFPLNEPHETINSKLCNHSTIEMELYNLNPNTNYVINGRFDYGYLYFKNDISEIIKKIKFHDDILDKTNSIIKNIQKPLVSLNFRRTDYPFYMDSYIEFYKKALDKIPDEAHILLISDDFDWINNSPVLNDLIYTRETSKANYNNFIQLCLMSKCDYNVCCPSSFSIWGSLLNMKNHKTFFPYTKNTSLNDITKFFHEMVDTLPICKNWEMIHFT